MLLKPRIAAFGLLLGTVLALSLLLSPRYLGLLHPGPMTPGHETIACASCHEPAPGSTRQQLQAKVRALLGLRNSPAAFGFDAPSSADCLGCHTRPDDRHPIQRFAEPRFADALRMVDARSCIGCHQEHLGSRVSGDGQFCASCHEELTLKTDPLDVSHQVLVAERRWDTCLGCHDYHGNHARTPQRQTRDAYSVETIRAYLAHGPDPYGSDRTHKARGTRE